MSLHSTCHPTHALTRIQQNTVHGEYQALLVSAPDCHPQGTFWQWGWTITELACMFVFLCFRGPPEDGSAERQDAGVDIHRGLYLVVSCECICWLTCAVPNVDKQFIISPTVYSISDIRLQAQFPQHATPISLQCLIFGWLSRFK